MANSDIIKIGFDYRASLAQFEKETNGVFDGISNKAGKQKITIQLDAKDDKVIDKIKELQKLKLDKFTFEFGNSGLKEQLQTFDKLENKINEIISLSKGIDLSFNTKNKTDAYNQLKKYADAFKDYYGNEEAMATNAGAKAGYAYYKAYEEALRKGVAQSKLEKVTIDFDVNDSFFSKERIVGNRIKEFENFQKYGNADESNLIVEITSLENRLLKFNSAYSQVKANLGDAPITPEITKNIEEYVRLLEVAESRAKDAELFGYSSEDINSNKDLANMYLDFAKEDATAENKKYIESLKQEETQAIATAEAEQKLAEAQKETVFNTSNSNNSQIEELKSDIQEVKTELGDVKDRISSIESNGFENVRDDVEKTKESVKELNSELTEMKSNLSSTSQELNISLISDSTVEQQIKSESELNAEIEKRENIIRELQQLQEKLTVHEDFHGNDRYFADQLPTEEEIREADKRIKQLTGTNNIFDVNKLIQDRNEWLSEVKYSLEEYDDLIKANDQKALDEYTTRGLSRIGGAESFFGYEDNNFSIASKFVEEKEKIQNEINDLYTDLDKLDEKMNLDSNNSSVDNTVQSQEKLQSELKETQKQAEKTAQAVKESTTTASTEQKKDAFPDKDVSAFVESATNSIKEENNILEQNTQKVKENTRAKEQNANANLNKYDKRLDSYNGKVDKYQATIDRFNDGGWTSSTYLENVQAVRGAVKQYATLLDNIKTNQNSIASDEDIQNLDKYEKKIKETIATVTNMSASEKGYSQLAGQKEIDKINKILRENSAMSSEAKAKIKAYKQELISGNPSVSLEKIHGEIMKIVNAEELAGRAGRSMFDVIKEKAFYGFAAQIGMYFGFNDIVNGFKQVASTVIDLNTQITDLAKVSEATSSQIYDDFSSYADIAKDIGGTISDTISATADWSRNGYNLPDSKELARVALLYKNVGDGIDIDTANESLISTLRGFKMEADEAEKIIDIFNNVSNNEPIDSGGIGEALQRSAASFNAANTSLQESVALISTTNSVIQNPEKVGNMWKVVSMRIRSATSELEQAGEDTDGLVTSTADLQKMIKAMTGYDILESDGKTFKSIYDIVLNISKVWNNLSDLDQSSLLQALAGKQQSNALAAALSNPELLEKSYQEAMDSAGSAAEEEKKYQQSVQYSIDQTKAKLEELSADLLSSDFLKGAIDAGGKLIEVLDGIVKSGNAIPTLLAAIGAGLSFKNVGEWNYISKFHSNNIICFIV